LEVKTYLAEVTQTCAVEVMSEIKSTNGEPSVFQNHQFNKSPLQGYSVFKEKLNCSTRELQAVSSKNEQE
jgi:hypothetical protein